MFDLWGGGATCTLCMYGFVHCFLCISRQVDDLNFRLEELSVISGDQLEKVAMKDDGELDELKKEFLAEQDKCAALESM